MKKDHSPDHPVHGYEMSHGLKIVLKQALLLTTAIFLMTAPTPDPKDIANISANFIGPLTELGNQGLKAGE